MKILLISNIFPPGFIGGYELAALEVASHLSTVGNDLLVLTGDYFYGRENTDFSVERSLDCVGISHSRATASDAYTKINIINFRNIRTISRHIETFCPDLILCFNIAGLGPVGIVKFLEDSGLPILFYFMDTPFAGIDFSGSLWNTAQRMFGQLSLNTKSAAIFMSERVKGEVTPFFDCSMRSTIVPGWVENIVKIDRETRPACQHEVPFVFCSRISDHKGIDLVVEAVRLSRERRCEMKVDIYGSGDVSMLARRSRAAGVDDLITYKGSLRKEEVVSTLAQYHALLFPTASREPFGFIVSEAAFSGCIPIMTSGIGAGDWFVHGEDSFKISRNAEALHSAMRNVIALSESERALISDRAKFVSAVYLSKGYWLRFISEMMAQMGSLRSSKIDPRLKTSYLLLSDLLG